MLPMLLKAARTKDLASYSVGNIVLTNVANAVHSVYVFDLPAGPVWLLHSFYVIASALMLVWCLRYRNDGGRAAGVQAAGGLASEDGQTAEIGSPGTSTTIPSLIS